MEQQCKHQRAGRSKALPVPRNKLPPREREVADIVYNRGEVTVVEIVNGLLGASNSAVRMMLMRLEAKGVVSRRRGGRVDYFSPPGRAGRQIETLLQRITNEHFEGSLRAAVLKMMEMLEARQPGSALDIARRYRWPEGEAGRGAMSA